MSGRNRISNFWLVTIPRHHIDGVDYADALHRAEIDGGAIVNFLGRENRAPDDVVHVSPIANLCAIAPNLERILLDEGASDHGDHGVIFHAARAVDREVAAGMRRRAYARGDRLAA